MSRPPVSKHTPFPASVTSIVRIAPRMSVKLSKRDPGLRRDDHHAGITSRSRLEIDSRSAALGPNQTRSLPGGLAT